MIVRFGGNMESISCLPFGVSEDPTSPHFADQLPLYAKRAFKGAWFGAEEIGANTEENHVLQAAR